MHFSLKITLILLFLSGLPINAFAFYGDGLTVNSKVMDFDFTLDDVCDFIREDTPEFIEDVENLIKLLSVFSPILLQTPYALVALALDMVTEIIGMKKELAETSTQ